MMSTWAAQSEEDKVNTIIICQSCAVKSYRCRSRLRSRSTSPCVGKLAELSLAANLVEKHPGPVTRDADIVYARRCLNPCPSSVRQVAECAHANSQRDQYTHESCSWFWRNPLPPHGATVRLPDDNTHASACSKQRRRRRPNSGLIEVEVKRPQANPDKSSNYKIARRGCSNWVAHVLRLSQR